MLIYAKLSSLSSLIRHWRTLWMNTHTLWMNLQWTNEFALVCISTLAKSIRRVIFIANFFLMLCHPLENYTGAITILIHLLNQLHIKTQTCLLSLHIHKQELVCKNWIFQPLYPTYKPNIRPRAPSGDNNIVNDNWKASQWFFNYDFSNTSQTPR